MNNLQRKRKENQNNNIKNNNSNEGITVFLHGLIGNNISSPNETDANQGTL